MVPRPAHQSGRMWTTVGDPSAESWLGGDWSEEQGAGHRAAGGGGTEGTQRWKEGWKSSEQGAWGGEDGGAHSV